MNIHLSPRYVMYDGLQIHSKLDELLTREILPGLGLDKEQIFKNFSMSVEALLLKNDELLAKRNELQAKINAWHEAHPDGLENDFEAYQSYLYEIGYLMPEGEDFYIETENIDAEIAQIAGPQLVVPVNNARFALNAANARWGSYLGALYATDAVEESAGCERRAEFNEKRGKKVLTEAFQFLDKAVPLAGNRSHADIIEYKITKDRKKHLELVYADKSTNFLKHPDQFVGYNENDDKNIILLKNNGLHIELQIDYESRMGEISPSGLKDIILEAALSTIQDCEDSVAAVDVEDKLQVYRNWLGLMKGDLAADFQKNGHSLRRVLQPDRIYKGVTGEKIELHGRSLLLVRNVGHLMKTEMMLDKNNNSVPEGIVDALLTSLCAMHDFTPDNAVKNSRAGSIYIVKPKMHGPEEVAFANELFGHIEEVLGLPEYTIKIGVMDEERRTTVNLKECIRAVKNRLFFINTGFLDRTGDEIHTSMMAGVILPKEEIKMQPWIAAYEDWNVDIGLETGLPGRAQIGKGMWPKPDKMREMLSSKLSHLQAGANCAWVPSPSAATLHATHYHMVDVTEVQKELASKKRASLDDILIPPLLGERSLAMDEIKKELENNLQSILGYVVRWIDQGIGCSKVPDVNDVGLMEDRATLRISSQHIANWLHHEVCTHEQVLSIMKQMAKIVDHQNAGDPAYQTMAPDFNGFAFQTACALVFEGRDQPNGYTEPLLHAYRAKSKEFQ